MSESYDQVVDLLQKATVGFDHLFSDELEDAKSVFQSHDSSFHLLGLGVCSFLEASLGMEVRPWNPYSSSCCRSCLYQVCIDDRGEYCVDQRGCIRQETTQGRIEDQQGYPQIPTRHHVGAHARRLYHPCWLDPGFEVTYSCSIRLGNANSEFRSLANRTQDIFNVCKYYLPSELSFSVLNSFNPRYSINT
jgi:hypothetical protein